MVNFSTKTGAGLASTPNRPDPVSANNNRELSDRQFPYIQ